MEYINKIEIKLLDYNERKVLKSIRLNKQIGDRHVWAELLYSRDILPNYIPKYFKDNNKGALFYNIETVFPQDDYDDMVLGAIRKKYPNAQMTSLDVNTDSCIERLRMMYDSFSKEQAIVYLTPDLSQIDPSFVPDGTIFTQFRVYIDIYTPSSVFLEYFKNEGYFDNYCLGEEKQIEKMLNEKLPTVHHLEELWS